ncbi:DUF3489 domain-containing protein [Tabrizicola sp. J26]|uniref:DUF3489 domain-containing protein n=1 Tax=Alitabrizicola rongguiensis TaxID=2909234 RepID=UPI001F361E7F|nr:DUF3489 domain-containing protein [Tabrizicola rongguiensis]MCF1709469.1 DUF3489 domain-containing protein [Tabrizicola rongguiensis]
MTRRPTPRIEILSAASVAASDPKAIQSATGDAVTAVQTDPRQTKADLVRAMLEAPGGARLSRLLVATGWQAHTMRAAISGLRKRGLTLRRDTIDGEAVYRVLPMPSGEASVAVETAAAAPVDRANDPEAASVPLDVARIGRDT